MRNVYTVGLLLISMGLSAQVKLSNGLTFDGVDDYVTFSDINAMDGMTAFTMSAWAKTPSAGSLGTTEKHIVDKSYCDGIMNTGSIELMVGGFTTGAPYESAIDFWHTTRSYWRSRLPC